MRHALAVAVAVLLGVGGFAAAANPEKVGTLVLVPVKDGPKVVEAAVGDLVQFEVSYPVVPNQIVSGLKVEVTGKGLSHAATVSVPKRNEAGQVVVGVGAIAAFLKADEEGEYTVKIVPRLAAGKDGPKTEFKVKVVAK